MEYVMFVMFCCSTRIGGLGQLQQIWMTAKLQNFKCQSSQRKIRNIQSESVSKTAGYLPQDSTAVSTQQRWLELQKFSSSTLFSCLQLCTKYTKEVTLWVTFFQLMWESERSTQKWIMQRQDSAEQGKDQKMCSKSEKRISVTFSDCFSIPDAPGSKSSLSKKYIFPLSLSVFAHDDTGQYSDPGARKSCWSSWRSVWVMWSVATPPTQPHPQYTGQIKSLMSPC